MFERRLMLAALFTLVGVALSERRREPGDRRVTVGRPPTPSSVRPGSDTLRGTPGDDFILGLAGNDHPGPGGFDYICGGPGRDRVSGGQTRRRGTPPSALFGGSGHDLMVGRPGARVNDLDE